MKTIQSILAVSAASALMSVGAFAGDNLINGQIKMVSNNHGQMTPMFVSCEPTVAVYAGGASAGVTPVASSGNSSFVLTTRDNAHGHQILVFRETDVR